jgi:hypothetical protein
VRSLGLKTNREWRQWCTSGRRPEHIPTGPDKAFEQRWQGWGDWLGTGRIRKEQYLPFGEARAYMHSVGLKSHAEWKQWCAAGKRPANIPASPDRTYGDQWQGANDWLGSDFLPFGEARAYMHSVGLKSHAEWMQWCSAGKRPANIPASPPRSYADKWQGLGDWLGTGRRQRKQGIFLPFKEARAYVHSLGLKTSTEWRQWCADGKRPPHIPRQPSLAYVAQWQGFSDWLGTQSKREAPGARPRNKAA